MFFAALRIPLLLFVFFGLAGCALWPFRPPADMPTYTEVMRGIRSRKIPSHFRGLVAVDLHLPAESEEGAPQADGGFAGKAVLLWQGPDSLRIEPLSPFGSPLYVVAARRGLLRIFSVRRGRFYEGPASAGAMRRWIGVPLSPALLVRSLQGRLPVLEEGDTRGGRLSWDWQSQTIRLDLPPAQAGGVHQTLWLDPKTRELVKVQWGEGAERIEVLYGVFRNSPRGRLPVSVTVEQVSSGRTLRVKILEEISSAGESLPHDLFEISIPPGTQVIPL